MRIFITFCIFINLLSAPFILLSGEISFVANTSKNKVAVGEQFQVTYTLNANGNGFKAPSFSDFQFLGGPSQSTSMQIINGNMSQSISYTYYLAGKAPGNYTLSSAGIAVNGKKIESNSLKIEVTKEQAAQNSPQQGRNQGNNRNNSNGAESISEKELADNVFLKAVASKTATYQGEQIVVTYKLYRRIDVVQYQLKEMPKYNGFWKEDIKIDNQNYNESIDGIQYLVTDLKKIVLVPQRSGQLQVDPLDIDVLIRLKARRSNNFFDDFFGMSSFQNYNLPLKSKPLTINVKSLPDNAPEGFSGIVGNLSISGKLTKDKLNANESVSLKVTISGKGNLKLIEPFKLNLPEEIETYDPKVSDNIIVNAQGISGSKTFEYLLIPRGGGDFKIAPLSFGYFDAQSNAYKTISTEEFKLSVKGQSLASSNLAGPQITHKEDVKIKGNDIAYIKSEPGLIVKNNYFFGSWIFNGLCFLIVAGTTLFFIYESKKNELRKDVKTYRYSQALKSALQQLKEINAAANTDLYYQQISATVYQYIGNKFNVGLAQATIDLVKNKLEEKKLTEPLYNDLKTILETCEMARFAPIQSNVEKDLLLQKTKNTIIKLEEVL